MKITSARFVTSLDALGAFPGRGLPEIAMVGRSNVGKSSLINRLCGNSKLAKTSAEPGKTRLINLYRVNDAFFLTDLPGYGFARAPKGEQARWARMIEGYLSGSQFLRHAFLLADCRHDPTGDDRMMAEYLRHYGIPFTVLATKADKLSGAKLGPALLAVGRGLSAQPWQVIACSAQTGQGIDQVLGQLGEALSSPAGAEDLP